MRDYQNSNKMNSQDDDDPYIVDFNVHYNTKSNLSYKLKNYHNSLSSIAAPNSTNIFESS
jgi:hypothetical protein